MKKLKDPWDFLAVAEPSLEDFKDGSVAWLIQKYLDECSQPGSRHLGKSHLYSLRTLQRAPIGLKQHAELKPVDYLDHCKARKSGAFKSKRGGAVKPQTIMQDMTYLSGVLKHAFEIWEMPETGLAAYRRAKPQLMKQQLIGKSVPRTRLPSDEEEARLRALFTEQNKRKHNKIDMVLVMDGELTTGRRISELCRIERQHVNVEDHTCWIYDLKNAKGKGYHAEFALIEGAWELFERRLKEIPDHPQARLFPFLSTSCSARYTEAKKILGIQGLRMHDNRAECFVRLLEKGYSETQVQKGVSLHKGDGKVLREVYLRVKAKDLHDGPAANRTLS